MKFENLLLGAAALVITAGGAQAADAVMMAPAPEPMEYVRVCDVYGAGFFYIPGTETCLKIDGYVWYQVGATNDGPGHTANYNGFVPNEWNKYGEARVNFDARSETEWGTLRAYIRMQSSYINGFPDETGTIGNDPDLGLDQAWLSLGGLRMGYTESAWAETVFNTPNWGSLSWGGMYYGYQQRQLIQYNWKATSGFFATVSLEKDPSDVTYMPDVVGVLGTEGEWGGVWGKVAYDDTNEAFNGEAGLQYNISAFPGSSLRFVGWYAEKANDYAVGGKWSVLASYYHVFNPKLSGAVSVQYFNDINYEAAGSPDQISAEVAAIWVPVTNFEVRSEVVYDKAENLDGTFSGFLRVTRFFGG